MEFMEFEVGVNSFISSMFPADHSNNDTFAAVTDFHILPFFLHCTAMHVVSWHLKGNLWVFWQVHYLGEKFHII